MQGVDCYGSIEHARTIVRAAPVVAAAKPEIYDALEERNVSYAIRIRPTESLEWVYWAIRMPKWKSWSKLHYVLGAP